MNTVLLYGGTPEDAAGAAVSRLVGELLRARGFGVDLKPLAGLRIHPCAGCFNCWLKTPGRCVAEDDGSEVMRSVAQSDAVVVLSPVTFGGYSSLLKRALDRILLTLLPVFQRVDGEMAHPLRYPPARRFLAVGWQAKPDDDSAEVFARLADRNARNMHAPASASVVINGTQPPEAQRGRLAEAVARLEARV